MYTPYSLKASHEKWEEALSALLEGRAAGPQAHRTQAASLTSNQPCPFHLRIQSAGFQPRLHPELALRLSPRVTPSPLAHTLSKRGTSVSFYMQAPMLLENGSQQGTEPATFIPQPPPPHCQGHSWPSRLLFM